MFDIIHRYDPAHQTTRPLPRDANEACQKLEAGIQTFASLANTASGFRISYLNTEALEFGGRVNVPQQHPFAVVLGCSGARVPTKKQ